MKIGYKEGNFDAGRYKRKPEKMKKEKLVGRLHNSTDDIHTIETIHFKNLDGTVRALVNLKNHEFFIVPPGKDDRITHRIYSEVCDAMNITYIDECDDFVIAVPLEFYIEMAKEGNLKNRIEEAEAFKKNLITTYDKWKKDNPA